MRGDPNSGEVYPVTRMESFRVVKLSRLESFRVMKHTYRVEIGIIYKMEDGIPTRSGSMPTPQQSTFSRLAQKPITNSKQDV